MKTNIYKAIALILTSSICAQDKKDVDLLPPPLPAFKNVAPSEVAEKSVKTEFFEKIGDGWTCGHFLNGDRVGMWWHWEDEDNWKKVYYDKHGEVLWWRKLIGGRRLFEHRETSKLHALGDNFDWYFFTIRVYELTWNKDRTLDWKEVDVITSTDQLNLHGHFNNPDGSRSKRRTKFNDKWKFGEEFKETLMGVKIR